MTQAWEWRGNQLYAPERQQTLLRDVTFWNATDADKIAIASSPELLSRLRLAAFWLEHLIEICEIDTSTTRADINAVNRESGNVRTLTHVSLETGWKDIQTILNVFR